MSQGYNHDVIVQNTNKILYFHVEEPIFFLFLYNMFMRKCKINFKH